MERPDRTVSAWRKSTYSGSNGGNCVEIAAEAERVLVRDTKHLDSAVLAFSPAAWGRFLPGLK